MWQSMFRQICFTFELKNTHLKTSSVHMHDLVEVVHVELAYKGGHVGVLVVVGQQGAGELGLVLD